MKNQRIWVRVIGQVEFLDGRPFRAFGSMQNVQAKKLAQIALETSTGWLKLSMNMAHMHAWRWDRGQDLLEFATADGPQLTAHEPQPMAGWQQPAAHGLGPDLPSVFPGMKKFMARVHPGDRLAVSGAIDDAFQHETEVQKEFG